MTRKLSLLSPSYTQNSTPLLRGEGPALPPNTLPRPCRGEGRVRAKLPRVPGGGGDQFSENRHCAPMPLQERARHVHLVGLVVCRSSYVMTEGELPTPSASPSRKDNNNRKPQPPINTQKQTMTIHPHPRSHPKCQIRTPVKRRLLETPRPQEPKKKPTTKKTKKNKSYRQNLLT